MTSDLHPHLKSLPNTLFTTTCRMTSNKHSVIGNNTKLQFVFQFRFCTPPPIPQDYSLTITDSSPITDLDLKPNHYELFRNGT